jgi:hypothetical protein
VNDRGSGAARSGCGVSCVGGGVGAVPDRSCSQRRRKRPGLSWRDVSGGGVSRLNGPAGSSCAGKAEVVAGVVAGSLVECTAVAEVGRTVDFVRVGRARVPSLEDWVWHRLRMSWDGCVVRVVV